MVKEKSWLDSSKDYAVKVFFFFLIVSIWSLFQNSVRGTAIGLIDIVAAVTAAIIASLVLGGIMAWLKTTKRGRNWNTLVLAVVGFILVWIIFICFFVILHSLKVF